MSNGKPKQRQEDAFNRSFPFQRRGSEMKAAAAAIATKKEEEAVAIRRSVKGLLFGGWEEKAAAAAAIRDWAKAEHSRRRELAELGVLSPLVSMLADGRDDSGRLAAEALVEIADGSFRNKLLIVEAGFLDLLPLLQNKNDPSTSQALAPLLLSISTLATTPFPIASLPILSFLLSILASIPPPTAPSTLACTAALCHLSTKLDNAKYLVSAGAIHALLMLCSDARAAEGALSALGNLVLSSAGMEAIQEDPLVPGVLVGVMAREGNPRSRELAGFLLMVLAQGSAEQRRRMAEAGVVPVLLEVALLGSGTASGRAIRMLGWFKNGGSVERGGDRFVFGEEDEGEVKQRRRAVRCLVKQSLDRNMESILRRGRERDGNAEEAVTW